MKRPEPLTEDQIKKIREERSIKRPGIFSERFGMGQELAEELIQLRAVVERIAVALETIASK